MVRWEEVDVVMEGRLKSNGDRVSEVVDVIRKAGCELGEVGILKICKKAVPVSMFSR